MKKRKSIILTLCAATLTTLFAFPAAAADGVSVSYDSGTLHINSDKVQTATLIQAAYDSDGNLVGNRIKNIALPYTGTHSLFPGATNKFMVWDSLDGMKSLCNPYSKVVEAEPEPEWKNGIDTLWPYQLDGNCNTYNRLDNEKFKMAGVEFTDGFTMSNNNAFALFNLDERYNAVKFKFGHVDNTDNVNGKLEIYLDRKLVQTIPLSYAVAAQDVTVETKGARGMIFKLTDIGRASYGFADFHYLAREKEDRQKYKGNWTEIFAPYEYTSATTYRREQNQWFNMSGYEYTNGFTLTQQNSEAIFNLQGRCTNLTFTAGHVDGTECSDQVLNIYLDRELMYEFPLYYNEVATERTISLLNKNGVPASQMKFQLANRGGAVIGFADGAFSYTEDTRPPAENNWFKVFAPYEYSYAQTYKREKNEKFVMSGEEYTDGFVMGGNQWNEIGEAVFNLKGKCTSLKFKVGHIDGKQHANRTLNVYLDRVLMQEIPLPYDDVAREYTISLINIEGEPASQLRLEIQVLDNDHWGFADGCFTYEDTPDEPTKNNWTKVFAPYQYVYTTAYREENDERFVMSGDAYTDGFVMGGDLWNDPCTVWFNPEGKCTQLTFKVGHVDGTEHRNQTLNVYLDKILMYQIPLYYNDIAREQTISLLNINGKTAQSVKFEIVGVYGDKWGFSDGWFDYTAEPAPPQLESTWLTDCPPYSATGCAIYQTTGEEDNPPTFTMSGYTFTDGIVTNARGTELLFNIGNKYKALKVMIGHIDSTAAAVRNMNVYINDVKMSSFELNSDDTTKEYEIPLLDVDNNPGSTLKLEITDMYNDAWGFIGGRFME